MLQKAILQHFQLIKKITVCSFEMDSGEEITSPINFLLNYKKIYSTET